MKNKRPKLSYNQMLASRILTSEGGLFAGMDVFEFAYSGEYTLAELEEYGRDVVQRSGKRSHSHSCTLSKRFRRRATKHKVEEQILDKNRSLSKFRRDKFNQPRTNRF